MGSGYKMSRLCRPFFQTDEDAAAIAIASPLRSRSHGDRGHKEAHSMSALPSIQKLFFENNRAFFVEAKWWASPTERQRLICHCDNKGAWLGSPDIREYETA